MATLTEQEYGDTVTVTLTRCRPRLACLQLDDATYLRQQYMYLSANEARKVAAMLTHAADELEGV